MFLSLPPNGRILLIIVYVTPPSPIAPSSQSPSPLKGPITRSMMKKIQKGLPLDDHKFIGLLTFFTWAKEITKT